MAYGTTDRLTGGTASASGFDQGAAANAVDNNEASYWGDIGAFPQYWLYDCGAGVSWAFGKLRAKNYLNYGINAFTSNGSNNGVDYTQLYSGNMLNNNSWQEFTWVNIIAYRYIKNIITSGYNAGEIDVYEFEAFEQLAVAGGFMIFLSEAWKKHDRLWLPKLIIPKDLGFQI